MSKRYDVMYPSQYLDAKGEKKTRFMRVGTAFQLKDKDGFSLELQVPLSRPARLVCFAFEPKDQPEADGYDDADEFDR